MKKGNKSTSSKKNNIKEIKIPKLPQGEGTISIFNDERLVYKKTIKGQRVGVYGKTVKEVLGKMKEKETKILNQKKLFSSDKITLYDDIKKWLFSYKQPKLKSKSFDRIENTLNNQIKEYKLGKIRTEQVKDKDIHNHIKELTDKGLSWSTIKKTYDLLNEFFRIKYLRIDMYENPMLTVSMPTEEALRVQRGEQKKEIMFFTDKDIKRFTKEATALRITVNKPKHRLGFVFVAMIFLGLRIGELIALQWKDIDFERNVITISKSVERVIDRKQKTGGNKYIDVLGSTKSYATRIISMNKTAKEMLLQHYKYFEFKEKNDYIICTSNKKFNNIANIARSLIQIEKYAKTSFVSGSTHVLRHTCASLYFRKEIPIEIIAKHLGHSVEVCRTTYIHFVNEQMAESASKINLNVTLD